MCWLPALYDRFLKPRHCMLKWSESSYLQQLPWCDDASWWRAPHKSGKSIGPNLQQWLYTWIICLCFESSTFCRKFYTKGTVFIRLQKDFLGSYSVLKKCYISSRKHMQKFEPPPNLTLTSSKPGEGIWAGSNAQKPSFFPEPVVFLPAKPEVYFYFLCLRFAAFFKDNF